MMRSLYSAISGLKNHQIKMDVIGNNIANVNTTGFKRSSVTFATALSQTMKGASSPTPTQGGTNPVQIGMGSMLGSINQIMTTGSSETTGNVTDMMLQGSGFFVLDNNGQQVFTRAGGFGKDINGNLVDPATGAKVQGFSWSTDDTTTPVWSAAGDIKYKVGDVLPSDGIFPIPESATTPYTPAGPNNLAAFVGAENLTIDGMTRVASNPASGQFSYDPTTGDLNFNADISTTNPLTIHYVDPAGSGTNLTSITVDTTSNTATVDYPPKPGAVVYTDAVPAIPYTLTSADTPGPGEYSVKALNGQYLITFAATDKTGTATALGTTVSYDFTNKAHTLTGVSIDQSGVITGEYSNGVDSAYHKIAQIEVASFANEVGLQNIGGSFYTQTNNSGTASIGAAGEGGRASVVSDTLEMSNVDLSTEMTDMITAQRGFQANSRVITVSDSLLQELIDLKRQ